MVSCICGIKNKKVKLTETVQKSGCQGLEVGGNKKRLVFNGYKFSANKMNEIWGASVQHTDHTKQHCCIIEMC